MNRPRIGIVGASGYSGAIAARLVAGHPAFTLAFVTSDKLAGKPARAHLGSTVPADLVFVPNKAAIESAITCDAVLLATPAEVSATLAPALLAASASLRVVDLSGAFRLGDAAAYPVFYGFDHPSPHLLATAWYGLPDLFGSPPDGVRLVANPGCYPTATLLAIAPLVREGLVDPAGIIVDAKSGVSGAGVQAKEEYSFVEIAEDVRAYKLLTHQHTPEIDRHLGRAAHREGLRVTFTPHLVPVRRGLIATCYGRPARDATPDRVRQCLADDYAGSPLVDVVIAVCAIDNLVKGAAGQAIQNVNRMTGQPDTAGLDHLHPIAP